MARLSKDQLAKNMQKLLDAEKPARKKFRKPRKPMTPEQKAAAAERLAAARAKKNAGKTPSKRYHPAVYDEKLQFKPLDMVLGWLQTAKEQASNYKRDMRGKTNKELTLANDKYLFWYGYYNDINWYLKHGDWISNTWGDNQQMKTKWKVVVPAYYPDGTRKDLGPPPIIEDNKTKRKTKRKAV